MKHCDKIHLLDFLKMLVLGPFMVGVFVFAGIMIGFIQAGILWYLGMKGEPVGSYRPIWDIEDKKLRFKEDKK